MIRLSSIIVTLLLLVCAQAHASLYHPQQSHIQESAFGCPANGHFFTECADDDRPISFDLSYTGDGNKNSWRSNSPDISELDLTFEHDYWWRHLARRNHASEGFGSRRWAHMTGWGARVYYYPDDFDGEADGFPNLPPFMEEMPDGYRNKCGLTPLWMIAFGGMGHWRTGHGYLVAFFPHPASPAETHPPAATPIPASLLLLASAGGCTGLFMKRRRIDN